MRRITNKCDFCKHAFYRCSGALKMGVLECAIGKFEPVCNDFQFNMVILSRKDTLKKIDKMFLESLIECNKDRYYRGILNDK